MCGSSGHYTRTRRYTETVCCCCPRGMSSRNKHKIRSLCYDRTSREQKVFIVYRAVVNICTARFNIERFYALNGVCVNVFCMALRAERVYLLCSINGLVVIERWRVYCAKWAEYFRCKFRLTTVSVFFGQVFYLNLLSTFFNKLWDCTLIPRLTSDPANEDFFRCVSDSANEYGFG